ncbi:MAG: asparagine synthase, partial [Alphaproteobacteria bacterium]|nr:asparagine synthase [Alphaproteobacteria bacterium]
DSSAVAATAARLLAPDGRVAAFTAVPRLGYDGRIARGRFADEGPHAAAVAAMYPNIDHVLIRSGQRSPFAALDRNFFLFERPMLNLCNAVWADAIMDAARERKLSVMLTGQMGNMSFSYTGLEVLPELLAGGKWLFLAKLAAQLRRHGTRLESVAAHTFGPFLPALLWTAINRLRGRHMKIGDYSAIDAARADRLRDDASAAGLDFSYRPRRDPVGTRLWVMGRVDLGSYNKGLLGGWGIDVRDPTADRALVELCLSIPAEAYLAGGRTRALARDAFADRLPRLVLDETRKGYQAADWHEGLAAGRAELGDEIGRIAALPEAEGVIDTAMLEDLAGAWPERDWNLGENQSLYRLALLRGVSSGHFLRKASGSNA